jgi:hypothetical protein
VTIIEPVSGLTDQQARPEKGTVPERRAFVAARREEARKRDAARFRLAEELAGSGHIEIPQERGFAVAPPDSIEPAESVIADANALIESIGHESLMSGKKTKEGFLARGFLPPEAYQLDSPYMRFALSEDVVAPIAEYLGLVPVLYGVDVWYSAHGPETPKSSQLWHLDHFDTKQIKVWIHCSDVRPESGPLTILDAESSDALADRIGYSFADDKYRVPDEDIAEVASPDSMIALEGPTGTVDFVDTSTCFHFGSRVSQGAPPRRMALFQYVTPYAFLIRDHREQAPYREQGARSSSELERLVLGAV